MLEERVLYSYNDIMIKPAVISSIEHRSECNALKDGKLPIFTSPMSCIIDENNFHMFNERTNAILPRNISLDIRYNNSYCGNWAAYSLHEFYECFCNEYSKFNSPAKALIDVANGHMSILYEYVKQAKDIHGNNLEIMIGNIANPETYKVAYEAGVDSIRCGIGGGAGCLTTSNTATHYPMASLIYDIYKTKEELRKTADMEGKKLPYIIADGGIRNYSDVIKALALGADYVMIGSLFGKLYESCAKTVKKDKQLYKEFYGMASNKGQIDLNGKKTKTSEGITKLLPVTEHLDKWTENMESYLRSAMSYTNIKDIEDFNPINVQTVVISKATQESLNK